MVVRACLSALPDHSDAAATRLRDVAPDEWPAFLDYIAAHGVLAVIEPALATVDVPSAVRADMQRRLLVQEVWAQQTTAAVESVAGLFARAGIPMLALKGPVFAARYHRTPSDRPSIDVDVLVRPEALAAARDVLAKAGYIGDTDLDAAYLLTHSHHLHFERPGEPQLELHFRGYQGFGVSMPAAALMDRAEPYLFNGRTPTLVASPEDDVVYLCAHAAGHSFIRLLWLYDLKLLLRARAVDWREVRARSEAMGLSGAVAYAATLLRQWLGVDGIPAWVAERPSRARGWVADRLLAVVAAPSKPSSADNLGGLVFTAMLSDRAWSAGRLMSHHLLRTARHRAHRAAPRLVPASWAS